MEVFMKIDRLLSILNILITNDKITANELADRLEVSKRTIFRDIDTLNMAGIPVVSYPGIGGGLGVLPGYKIDKNIFSLDDIKNILTGLLALQSMGDKTKINHLITKISPQTQNELQEVGEIMIDFSSWFSEGNFQQMMEDFRQSIIQHQVVSINYHSKSILSERKVEPYKLIFKYSFWYLYGYCYKRNAFRMFKLKSISTYEVLSDSFEPKTIEELKLNFDFEASYAKPTKDSPLQEIVLEYDIKDKMYLIDKLGAYNVKGDTDSGLIIFHSSNLEWVADFVVNLQDKVKVLQPQSLLDNVKVKIEKMNKLYKS